MRKERSLPVLAKVLGVGAIGLAAACGAEEVARQEVQDRSLPSIPVPETQTRSVQNIEAEPAPPEVNLFSDPSFESGDWRNNWVILGTIQDEAGFEQQPTYLSLDSQEAHSGLSSLKMTVVYDNRDVYRSTSDCTPREFIWGVSGRGFYPNSEILITPGVYEFGFWAKAKITSQLQSGVPRSVGFSVTFFREFFNEQDLDLGNLIFEPTSTISDWQKLSILVDIPQEVNSVQPRTKTLGLIKAPCVTTLEVWFDDVFLTPATPPAGAEVVIIKDPLAEEKFIKKLEEQTQPFIERGNVLLPKMITENGRRVIVFLTLAPQEEFSKVFGVYHRALSWLVEEYQAQRNKSSQEADLFLDLAKDLCFFIRENFPEDFEVSHNSNCQLE